MQALRVERKKLAVREIEKPARGEEVLEWRLPISVGGGKQIVELTSQNVYTRARSF